MVDLGAHGEMEGISHNTHNGTGFKHGAKVRVPPGEAEGQSVSSAFLANNQCMGAIASRFAGGGNKRWTTKTNPGQTLLEFVDCQVARE